MKLKSLGVSFLFVLAMSCSGSSGTGSGSSASDVETGTSTGDVATDARTTTTDALSIADAAISEAFAQGSASLTRATLEEITGDCTPSGSYTLSGTYDDDFSDSVWSYDFTISYNPCGELDGELTYAGDYTVTDTTLTYSSLINGTVGGYGCETTFDNLTYSFSYDTDNLTYAYLLDGSYTSECDGSTFACTFDNVDLLDADAYYGACTLDGEPVDSTDDAEALEFTDEIQAFFAENSGSHVGVVTASDGNVGTEFTDGNSYNVTISESGTIIIETDAEDINLDFSYGHYFETNDTESTFVWKNGEELNATFQNDTGEKELIVVIDTDGNTDVWTFALTLE